MSQQLSDPDTKNQISQYRVPLCRNTCQKLFCVRMHCKILCTVKMVFNVLIRLKALILVLIFFFRREYKPTFLFYKVWGEQDHRAAASLERLLGKLGLVVHGQHAP